VRAQTAAEALRPHHCPSGEQEEAREDAQEGGVREAGGGELQEDEGGPHHHGQAAHGPHRALLRHQLLLHHQVSKD